MDTIESSVVFYHPPKTPTDDLIRVRECGMYQIQFLELIKVFFMAVYMINIDRYFLDIWKVCFKNPL